MTAEEFKDKFRPWLDRLHVHGLYTWLRENKTAIKVLRCKFRYARHIRRIRSKPTNQRIRVLFIVSEIAKWKEQKVYEAMAASDIFEPVVGLSAWNKQSSLGVDQLALVHDRAELFFKRLGVKTVRTVRICEGKKIFCDLSEFKPDIVYYTEPWGPCEKQDPWCVSKYALTVYTPYFTPNYGVLDLDCHQYVHRLLYAYFTLNEEWCNAYKRSLRFVAHSTKFIPTGHPGLDFFANAPNIPPRRNLVIYAPHFSFFNPSSPNYEQHYSTFDKNCREILAYAKAHKEFNWVFKPHPILKEWVISSRFMTANEIAEYYHEWARIGTVCEDGDYQQLFLDSRVLITDCGSFLTEYGSTGRPIIHLVSSANRYKPIFLIKDVYETYYRAHNFDEMYRYFKLIIEDGVDPNREIRLAMVKQAGICNSHSSELILKYIKCLLMP